MKLSYERLAKIHTKLQHSLNNQRLAFKVLAVKDKTGLFAQLWGISAGLKLNIAMEAVRVGSYCSLCKTNLCRNSVCPTCLLTEDGRNLSVSLRYAKASSTWSAFSEEKLSSITQRREDSYMHRYGVRHPMHSDTVKRKLARTMIRRYGVTNPSYSSESRKKREATSILNRGYAQPLRCPVVQAKVRATLKLEGVYNAMQLQRSKDKCKASWAKSCEGGHPLRDPAVRAAL